MKVVIPIIFFVMLFSISLAYATTNAVIHLDNIPESIKENSTITFSGQLITPDGISLSHRTIFIEDDTSYIRHDVILGIAVTDDNGKFSMSWKVVPKSNGNPYHFYALFLGGNTYGFTRSETYESHVQSSNAVTSQVLQSSKLPNWFKDGSKLWHDRQIRDLDFAHGIENLMDQGIMQKSNQTSSDIVIPAWVKNNANWYAEGQISEEDFVNSIQYLINNDIMKV